MNVQQEWTSEVRAVFNQIKSEKERYKMEVNGISLVVFPNVFSPKYFTDSAWFAEILPQFVKEGTLLEIGTGTGIVALSCALQGARVCVTDINSAACVNAKKNFSLHNIDAKVYCGDMFKPISVEKKFDVIFWNHPFNCGDNPNEEILLQSGFDYAYQGVSTYISEGHDYLTSGGRLLLGTGNFARLDLLEEFCSACNCEMVLLVKKDIPLVAGSKIANDYRIYEIKKK